MRGTTLNTLIQMLRRELKVAESPALGKNTRDMHIQALTNTQQRLATEDWPFLNIRRDVSLEAGSRYYQFPPDLDADTAMTCEAKFSGLWQPVDYGITSEQYNQLDSENDVRNDPVLRWQLYSDPDNVNTDMLEVWPLPASNGGTLRFNGKKLVPALINDDDKCILDDLMIVLFAAVDLVPQKDQPLKLRKAQDHYTSLRRNLSKRRVFSMSGCRPVTPQRRVLVTYASARA